MKKKIFFLVSRVPFPLEKGDKLRAYYQLKELSKIYDVCLVCLSDKKYDENSINELKKYAVDVKVFKLNKFKILINLFLAIFSKLPFQTKYFYQKKIQKKIQKIIVNFQPNYIYCQLIRTTEYVKYIHDIPKTLDYMDALSKGMLRRAEINKGIKKELFLTEGRRLIEYENRIFDYFDHHTIISKQDLNFINHIDKNKIQIVENGIDDSFLNYKNQEIKKEFDLVFVGNLNYPPNIEAVEFIVKDLIPLLRKKIPDIKILISGFDPSQKLEKMILNQPEITLKKSVKDIRESYASGKVFIAPLFIGTGLQNKILEAMAMNLPCITTNLVNSAIQAEKDKEIIIANSPENFINAIKELLGDEILFNSISTHAKEFVSQNYSWEKSIKKIKF